MSLFAPRVDRTANAPARPRRTGWRFILAMVGLVAGMAAAGFIGKLVVEFAVALLLGWLR
jgi:hypothetical protein